MTSKLCKKCDAEKPVTEFYAHKQMRDGRLNTCKQCFIKQTNAAEQRRMTDPTNRAIRNTKQRAWRNANLDKTRVYKKTYMTRHRDRALAMKRTRRMSNAYGLSPQEYEQRLGACCNKCQICDNPPGGRWNKLYVDHDHKTGKVRGMLCLHCNTAIGHLNDDPVLVEAVAAYLRHGGKKL